MSAELIVEFHRVWPILHKAVKRFGDTHRKEHVLARILDGRARLWTSRDAAIVTSIEVYDSGYKEIVGWLAAGKMEGVMALKSQAEAWGRLNGCNRARLVCRKGFTRAFPDYREIAVNLVKEL